MSRKNLRRINELVTTQTWWHLKQDAAAAGYGDNIGKVIDDWSKAKRFGLQAHKKHNNPKSRKEHRPCE